MEKHSLSFEATLVSVYKLFKDQAYEIPAYQRDYSWDTEQWEQLWSDLSDFKSNSAEEHFLGPLIVTPSENGGDTFEVIDGQQRLTTLQIIIAIVRDCWIQMGNKSTTKSGVSVPNKQMTAELIYSLTPAVRHNFTPNKHLRKIFRDFIQTSIGDRDRKSFDNKEALQGYQYNDRASEVVRAYKYFYAKIISLGEEDLRKFEEFLLQNVRLLKVTAGGSSNAFLLFETLNYRGLELTQTDLVKSYLFSRILTDDAHDHYVNEWDLVVDNIGGKSPDLFLRHYLLLYNKKVMKRDIYAEIKNKYKNREQAIALVDDLARFSSLYSYLVREKEFEGQNKDILNILFDDLALLNVDTQNIYLLAILYQFYAEKTKVDLEKIENAARLSETLSFRWITCGRNAQDLESIYQEAASMVMDKETPEDNFEEAQKLILENLPSDQEFQAALQNAIIKSNRRGQYILRKIDEWQNGDASSYVLMDPSKLHLEHIAPQRPSPDSDWKSKMKGELNYREIIYRIGNMMLLRDRVNKSVSNLNFDKKLVKYEAQDKKSKMTLPTLSKNVLTYEVWNQEAVLNRSKEIAEIATEVWSAKSTTMKGKAREIKKTRRKRKTTKSKSKTQKNKS
jgi:uncharacterized protein with ParB-like and HNH nuclease domain